MTEGFFVVVAAAGREPYLALRLRVAPLCGARSAQVWQYGHWSWNRAMDSIGLRRMQNIAPMCALHAP